MRTSLGYLIISLSLVVNMTAYAQVSIPENLDYYQHILKQIFITQDGTKPTEQNLDSIINDDQGNVYIKNGVYLGDAKPSTVDKGLFVDGRSRIGKDLYTQGNMGIGIQPSDKKALVKGNVHIGDMITVDGKLGVNVDTPLANLHVQGDVKFTGLPQADDATQGLSIGLDGMVGTYGFAWKKNGSVIQNLNNGNVGIGTQDPQAKLHVVGNVKTTEEGGPQDGAQMDTVILSYVGLEDEVDTKGCDIKKDIAEALGKTEDCPKPECTVPNCKECTASAAGSGTSAGGSGSAGGTCALCEEGYDLKDGKCEKTCSDSAGTGKDCNECKEGFVKKDNKCVLPTCDTYTGSSECSADEKCIWNEEKKLCEDKKGCSTYSEEPKCSADPKCEWDTEKKVCEDKGSGSACTDYKDQPKCDADEKCEWDLTAKVCKDQSSGSGACPAPSVSAAKDPSSYPGHQVFNFTFGPIPPKPTDGSIYVVKYESQEGGYEEGRGNVTARMPVNPQGYQVILIDPPSGTATFRAVCDDKGKTVYSESVVVPMNGGSSTTGETGKIEQPQCGTANTTTVSTQPTAEQMCASGLPVDVLKVMDKYTWSCKAGAPSTGVVNCFANMTGQTTTGQDALCGSSNGKKYANSQELLTNGEPCKPGTIFQSDFSTDSWTWICKSDNGGKDSAQCSASKETGSVACPVAYLQDTDGGQDVTFTLTANDPTHSITAFDVQIGSKKINLGVTPQGSDSIASPSPYTINKRDFAQGENVSVSAVAICGGSSTPAMGSFSFIGVQGTSAVACPVPTLSATPITANKLTMTWSVSDASKVTSYKPYRKKTTSTAGASTTVTQSPFDLTNTEGGATYVTKVKAVCGSQESDRSSEVSVTMPEYVAGTDGKCGIADEGVPGEVNGFYTRYPATSELCQVGEPTAITSPRVVNYLERYCKGANGGKDAKCGVGLLSCGGVPGHCSNSEICQNPDTYKSYYPNDTVFERCVK